MFSFARRRSAATQDLERIDLFRVKDGACVAQASPYVIVGQAGIVPENFFLSPSLSQQIDNELHGESSSFHDRLTNQNFRVNYNALTPVHGRSPF